MQKSFDSTVDMTHVKILYFKAFSVRSLMMSMIWIFIFLPTISCRKIIYQNKLRCLKCQQAPYNSGLLREVLTKFFFQFSRVFKKQIPKNP